MRLFKSFHMMTLFLGFIFFLGPKLWAQDAASKDQALPADIEYSGQQSDEWSKAQKDLLAAKIKLENDQRALEALKQQAEAQENLTKDMLEKINQAKKTVKESEQNYQRFLKQYNLRFPEKGLDIGRKYKRLSLDRDDDLTVDEKPQGVDAKLRRLNRNIKRQYVDPAQDKTNKQNQSKKQKKKQTSDDALTEPELDEVTEPIILEK